MEGKEEEKVEGKEMEEDWGGVWGREGKRLSLSDLMSPLCLPGGWRALSVASSSFPSQQKKGFGMSPTHHS